MSVDLPAPFSPTSACTSPGASARPTRSSARTPGNALTIPRASITVSASTRPAFLLPLSGGLFRVGRRTAEWVGPPASAWASVRAGQGVLGVRRVVRPVGDDDVGLDGGAAVEALRRLEG